MNKKNIQTLIDLIKNERHIFDPVAYLGEVSFSGFSKQWQLLEELSHVGTNKRVGLSGYCVLEVIRNEDKKYSELRGEITCGKTSKSGQLYIDNIEAIASMWLDISRIELRNLCDPDNDYASIDVAEGDPRDITAKRMIETLENFKTTGHIDWSLHNQSNEKTSNEFMMKLNLKDILSINGRPYSFKCWVKYYVKDYFSRDEDRFFLQDKNTESVGITLDSTILVDKFDRSKSDCLKNVDVFVSEFLKTLPENLCGSVELLSLVKGKKDPDKFTSLSIRYKSYFGNDRSTDRIGYYILLDTISEPATMVLLNEFSSQLLGMGLGVNCKVVVEDFNKSL